MRNTKEQGILHIRIFKWNGRYLGICKETGFVEEGESFGIAKKKMVSGITVLLGALHKSKQNLEPSVNTTPPFKYLLYFYLAPILIFIESYRDSGGEYDFSAQSIHNFHLIRTL